MRSDAARGRRSSAEEASEIARSGLAIPEEAGNSPGDHFRLRLGPELGYSGMQRENLGGRDVEDRGVLEEYDAKSEGKRCPIAGAHCTVLRSMPEQPPVFNRVKYSGGLLSGWHEYFL